ncbi:hypothetical protein [Streptomyces sp. NBC_00347]|uniref:hypothetical protein n=1 Tax=Streptomyces sp. NBC_00347 TaxID=2975721 RepID=UPI002251BFA7|nr:hypothetical protein [Streptomyces sp. NBC_00347]MCX5129462.1 hypothetical protein [Streptomyces sp. NBC_00347]
MCCPLCRWPTGSRPEGAGECCAHHPGQQRRRRPAPARRQQPEEALLALPAGAGRICDATAPAPGILFCFRLTHPDHDETVFVRVSAADYHGAHSLDLNTCLAEPRLDLTDWLGTAAARPTLAEIPLEAMPDDCLHTLWNLIDAARDLIARDHDIPTEDGTERVQLVAWLYLNPT